MTPRTMFRKSELIAPAEAALRNAASKTDLEDAWFDFCDGFADESVERKHLLEIYMDMLARFKAEHLVKLLGA